MQTVRRLILVRHGETDGQSSVRYFGRTDVELSAAGAEQIRGLAGSPDVITADLIASSPLKRAWKSAQILGAGRPVQLVDEFMEIDFGRWDGLTRAEIEASDPVLAKDWQAGAAGFEYPGGELRQAFRERVRRGLARLASQSARSALVVAHKGVIRAIVESLTETALERDLPPLGGKIVLTRQPTGPWTIGTRGSNPPGLETP